MAHSTILSQLSAIAYLHKLHGLPDPTKSFLVSRAIRGVLKLAPSYDVRLPITEHILSRICTAIPHVAQSQFERLLVHAVFTTAFYGLARIGELLPHSHHTDNVLQFSDVSFEASGSYLSRMHVTFRHFKHNTASIPHVIPLETLAHAITCPVSAMVAFLQLRGSRPGPLFMQPNGPPFLRHQFQMLTERCLQFCDLDTSRYKGHSFRIGGASLAAARGMSDAQIRLLGRWKTDAFKRYIRCTSL